jgi:hypothetical protein
MSNFDLKKYLAEGRLLKENIYTATDDDGFGSFIDDFASTIGYDNNTVHPSAVEMAGEPIEITPQHFIAHSPAWREFGYEKYWNRIPDGQPFKITGDTVGLTDYPFLKNYTFIKRGNVIKGKIDMAEGRIHLNEENLPDNITSVVDDMTITMGEDAFIAAIFKALSLEDAKRVLRVITKDNPIEHPSGPVNYDWLNEGKLNENVIDMQWTAYVKSLVNDIRLNGVEQYKDLLKMIFLKILRIISQRRCELKLFHK